MRKDGIKTREQIIEEALQIFSVKGYFNTSINDILAATGLTKGGLYGHFASKEELWGAAYERAVGIWKEIVFSGVREIADPIERIGKVVVQILEDARITFRLGGRKACDLLLSMTADRYSFAVRPVPIWKQCFLALRRPAVI
ncbi:MAG: hypothetical protein HW377_1100 [Actinobacteria bacterium]|nr:hypothetical protein [Actinomycetota bacterium]